MDLFEHSMDHFVYSSGPFCAFLYILVDLFVHSSGPFCTF